MRDLAGFIRYLGARGQMPATIIDAGACYGTPALQDGAPDAYHVLIEPLTEMAPRMQALLATRRGEYHAVALGAAPGTARMKVEPGAPEGASLAGTGALSARDPRLRDVPVETLDRIIDPRDLRRPILLKTDCQGHDLNVLQGAQTLLAHTDVVVAEANLFHPAGDRTLGDLGAIVAYLRGHGFAIFDILSYQTRPRDDALGYVDLAFVREDGPLRAEHRWA